MNKLLNSLIYLPGARRSFLKAFQCSEGEHSTPCCLFCHVTIIKPRPYQNFSPLLILRLALQRNSGSPVAMSVARVVDHLDASPIKEKQGREGANEEPADQNTSQNREETAAITSAGDDSAATMTEETALVQNETVTVETTTKKQPKLSYTCRTCKKKFRFHCDIVRHERIHSGEKPFCCPTCNKRFAQSGHLILHRRTHSGEKPFKCETCDKTFSHSSDLIKHKRTHTGEKPYECEHCGRRFTQSAHLVLHVRSHAGLKPYGCETCNKQFARVSSLKRHQRRHNSKPSIPGRASDPSEQQQEQQAFNNITTASTGES